MVLAICQRWWGMSRRTCDLWFLVTLVISTAVIFLKPLYDCFVVCLFYFEFRLLFLVYLVFIYARSVKVIFFQLWILLTFLADYIMMTRWWGQVMWFFLVSWIWILLTFSVFGLPRMVVYALRQLNLLLTFLV